MLTNRYSPALLTRMTKHNDKFKEMAALVEQWKKKYGKSKTSNPIGTFNPTKITLARVCIACASSKSIQRHHKANDFMFARLLPDKYAARYIEFHEQDCDNLCADCHSEYHEYIDLLVREFWDWINYYVLAFGSNPSFDVLEAWKKIFLFSYTVWLKNKQEKTECRITKPSPKKKKNTQSKL